MSLFYIQNEPEYRELYKGTTSPLPFVVRCAISFFVVKIGRVSDIRELLNPMLKNFNHPGIII